MLTLFKCGCIRRVKIFRLRVIHYSTAKGYYVVGRVDYGEDYSVAEIVVRLSVFALAAQKALVELLDRKSVV